MASSSNSPFLVALFETDTRHEAIIVASAALHIVATFAVLRLTKDSWLTAKLRRKESPPMAACLLAAYIVGFVHAVIVSVASVLVVVYGRYEIWPLTIAYSIGYFISDFIFYALPTRQLVMVIHHVVMIIGHYPTMERPAAVLYGAGDAELIMWLSAVGYLTEISNIFLDVRWFQLKVFGTPATLPYALNSLLLLVSYVVTRVLIMPIVRAHAAARRARRRARSHPATPSRRRCTAHDARAAGDVDQGGSALRAIQAGRAAHLLLRRHDWRRLHHAHVRRVHGHPAQARRTCVHFLRHRKEGSQKAHLNASGGPASLPLRGASHVLS